MKVILNILFLSYSTTFMINNQSLIMVQNEDTPAFYTEIRFGNNQYLNSYTISIPGGSYAMNANNIRTLK